MKLLIAVLLISGSAYALKVDPEGPKALNNQALLDQVRMEKGSIVQLDSEARKAGISSHVKVTFFCERSKKTPVCKAVNILPAGP